MSSTSSSSSSISIRTDWSLASMEATRALCSSAMRREKATPYLNAVLTGLTGGQAWFQTGGTNPPQPRCGERGRHPFGIRRRPSGPSKDRELQTRTNQ